MQLKRLSTRAVCRLIAACFTKQLAENSPRSGCNNFVPMAFAAQQDMLLMMMKISAAATLLAAGIAIAIGAPPDTLTSDEKSFIDFAGQTDLVNVRLAQ